jgi:hypothetical protein
MKKIHVFMGLALVLAIVSFVMLAKGEEGQKVRDGKTIFVEAKCVSCHPISAEGLQPAKKASGKMIPPDLSDVGTKLKSDFLSKYITKEEMIDGKKHLIAFKGEPNELKILSDWLESLKKAPVTQEGTTPSEAK